MEYHRNHALSCGVLMITGLQYYTDSPERLCNRFLNEYIRAAKDREIHPAYNKLWFSTVIFSDNEDGSGNRLAEKLTELGTITRSPFRMNPNSGNRIAVWVWQPSDETKTMLNKRRTLYRI